jgi:dTDP-4-amino-4,6-dideoxygalactose transaminase
MKLILENRASIIIYNLLKSIDFKGKFLLPANVCPILPATFLKAQTKFSFVDINEDDLCMGEEVLNHLERDEAIKGVIYVRTFGSDKEPDGLFRRIKEISPEVVLIDDKCLSVPQFSMSSENTIADVVLFSTGYSKYVDLGYGGYAFIKKDIEYKREVLTFCEDDHNNLLKQFKYSLELKKKFSYHGTDWLGDCNLEKNKDDYFNDIIRNIRRVQEHKQKINRIYKRKIPNRFQLKPELNNWRFNILIDNKHEVLKKIFDHNLFASSHYQSLVNIFGSGTDENAKKLHSRIINLFNDFRFSEDKAFEVSKIISKYAK